jgi:hypothetical protein
MKVYLNKCKKELDLMFGTDAEFFLVDSKGDVVPASQVIPGKKHDPYILEHGVCHPDGLSLEVGCPPSDTAEGMLMNLFKVINEVKVKFLDPAGVTIKNGASVNYKLAKNPTAEDLEFGCGSEFDVNSDNMMKHSNRDTSQELRFSGFHIHLGYTSGQVSNYFTFLDSAKLVRVLDNLVLKHNLNTTSARSQQYGGLGAFRVKPYGIEYRCMDCSVITNASKFQQLLAFLSELPTAMQENL